MTVEARIYDFPTDPQPLTKLVGGEAATFEEYLVSAGLKPSTVINYTYFLRRALEECDLHSADAEGLLAMADAVTDPDTAARKTLGAALSHWFRFQGVADPPHWVRYSPTDVRADTAWIRPGTYEAYLVSVGVSNNTIRAYSWQVNRAAELCQEMGGDLATASGQMLAEAANQIGESHAQRAQLRSGLKHYYTWQDRNDAPLQAVRVPPAPALVNQALDADEAKTLVGTATGWWPKGSMVLLGMYLGLRRFEIAKAEWDRFDDTMEWYRVTGKRDKTATLPVHPALRAEFAPRRGQGFIFPGRFGGPVNPATVWSSIKEVAAAAGLGDVRPHQLRHTALTTALDNTENLRTVMEFARHTKPQTTAGYTRTTKEQLRSVSDALDY